ncbi:hypothetical protein [Prevotella sp. 10(H)]|uniref:hypothetical protein n=1 Tax=Prevotella sp. 10(H) TaxID=1158294 RepID=UPI0012DED33C|nr:hypothetical protein [Prevotella sp. 10(H)]
MKSLSCFVIVSGGLIVIFFLFIMYVILEDKPQQVTADVSYSTTTNSVSTKKEEQAQGVIEIPDVPKVVPEVDNSAEAKKEIPKVISTETVGVWKNAYGIYTIYKEKGIYYMESEFIDGSGMTQQLSAKTRKGQKSFNVAGDESEYFIIKNGDLYIYDSYGDLGDIYKRY